MDTLKSLKVFRTIVEKGSLTKASEHLNLSLAMTSKHLQHLENHVQAKLLQRNNRKLSLTQIGEHYYVEAVHALDILQDAKTQAQIGTLAPQGTLRLIAPVWFSTPQFVNLLAAFQRQHPQIELVVDLENRMTDLIEQCYNLAIRVVKTPQQHLIARQLGEINFYAVASPEFVAQYGYPKDVADLVNFQGAMPNYTHLNISLPAYNQSNDTRMLAQMARAGMGIAILPDWLIEDELQPHTLLKVLNPPILQVPFYAVYVNRTFLNAKIRLLVDFMVAHFKYLNNCRFSE